MRFFFTLSFEVWFGAKTFWADVLQYRNLSFFSRFLVRRTITTLLLLLFLVPLISPLFAANAAETKLPAYCRRDGKHHCEMPTSWKSGDAGTKTIQAFSLRQKCPSYPVSPITVHIDFSTDKARDATYLGIIGLETCVSQTEARYRISFDRSRQKRGPPNQPLFVSL
jgi:hypothetical protein